MARLVLDSSALISLAESCTLSALAFLKEKAAAEFLAPGAVYKECVDNAEKIKRYGFSAIRIAKLFEDGIVKEAEVEKASTDEILGVANKLFSVSGKPLELIQLGESECMGLLGSEKNLVIDEKTLRLLIEDPNKLRVLLKDEYEDKIEISADSLAKWQQMTRGIKVLRSAELLAVAAKKGYFDSFKSERSNALKFSIYALRGVGCSLTKEELTDYEGISILGR